METRAGYLIVGSSVLVTIAGIFAFFLWIAKTDLDYHVKYYTIYFPGSVTGLSIGGAVNYLGVPVGTVKEITLDPKDLQRVDVTVAIREDIPIREDAYASLELQGLTGYKLVQLYGGSKDSPLLKAKQNQRYPVIPAKYSGVEEIMTTLPRMVNKLTNLVDRINVTFNESNRERISSVLEHIDILTQELAKSAKPLRITIEEAQSTLQVLKEEIQEFGTSAKSTFSNVDSMTQDLAQLLSDNKIALDSLGQTGSYELLQTLSETKEMVSSVSQFFERLDENPRSLLFDTQRKGVSLPQ